MFAFGSLFVFVEKINFKRRCTDFGEMRLQYRTNQDIEVLLVQEFALKESSSVQVLVPEVFLRSSRALLIGRTFQCSSKFWMIREIVHYPVESFSFGTFRSSTIDIVV